MTADTGRENFKIMIIIEQMTEKELRELIRDVLSETIRTGNSNSKQEEELLTVKETAQLLKVSITTIHKWIDDSRIKAYRFNTRIRIKKSELLNEFA